jgi:hypothetical protein
MKKTNPDNIKIPPKGLKFIIPKNGRIIVKRL